MTIWMTICRRNYLVNMHMCAKIGTSRYSRLCAVHNRATHHANYGVNLWSRPRSNLNPAIESQKYDFLFVDNDNVCSICHRLRDIDSGIVHDLDLEL